MRPACASASNQLAVYAPLVKWSTTIDAKTVSQQVTPRHAHGDRLALRPRAFRAATERNHTRGRRVLCRVAAAAEDHQLQPDRLGPEAGART
jgi:hypothetical protein